MISSPSSPRAALAPLLEAFAIDVREGPRGLEFCSRLSAGSAPMQINVVADPENGALFAETRGELSEFANEAVLLFADPLSDHAAASARSRRLEGEALRQRDMPLSLAFEPGLARAAADRWLQHHRLQRRRLRFALPPQMAALQPGDTLRLDLDKAPQGLFRILRIEDGDLRRIEAVSHAGAPAVPSTEIMTIDAGSDASASFAPELMFMDVPALSGSDETAWARAAGLSVPWRRIALSSSVESEGYAARATLRAPARVGALVSALAPSDTEGRILKGPVIEVDLAFGGLASVSRLSLLNGANVAAILSDAGTWEVVQFELAEETLVGRWRLSNLLRGQGGTDDAMRAGASAGNRFVLIDSAVVPLGLTLEEAGRTLNWIAEPLGLAADGAVPQVFAGGERALIPLSPVHLTARRETGGVRFRWIRRGRLQADSWSPAEIADDEGFERYRAEILLGDASIRTAETVAPEWLYTDAEELADFGAEQSELTLRVAQAGKRVPWGIARTATLPL